MDNFGGEGVEKTMTKTVWLYFLARELKETKSDD